MEANVCQVTHHPNATSVKVLVLINVNTDLLLLPPNAHIVKEQVKLYQCHAGVLNVFSFHKVSVMYFLYRGCKGSGMQVKDSIVNIHVLPGISTKSLTSTDL
jgi:hypothetical protein